MENNGNENLASSLCQAGCGFFGNPQFDGMCSKCYKDSLKRKQAAPSDSTPIVAASNHTTASTLVPNTTPSVETALPTVASTSPIKNEPCSSTSPDASPQAVCDIDEVESPSKGKKRNRCHTCKKKVGLTGFECRCGGLFCSIHRYSDKHNCQFDYKEHGADHIRKNNPVVVGEKVQKL